MTKSVKKIIYYNNPPQSDQKAFPDKFILQTIAKDAEPHFFQEQEKVLFFLESVKQAEILLSNIPDKKLFEQAKNLHPEISIIMVTDQKMEQYSKTLESKEELFVDHVIANRFPDAWTINEIRVTVQKILQEDIFGLEKYFAQNTPIQSLTVKRSLDRENFNTAVMQYAEKNLISQYVAKLIFGITEELLMNAIYDAPAESGTCRYGDLPRTMAIDLKPHEYSTLSFGCDGSVFGVSVLDPFGALKKEKLFQYLRKVVSRYDGTNLIDNKKGGAGLGLFKILYSSHALICNVEPKKRTEVISLIDIQNQIRDFSKMVRSVHYFCKKQ